MENQNFLQTFIGSIVSYFQSKVNDFTYNKLQTTGQFDADQAYYAMKERGYETLGEYTTTTFLSGLFSRKSSF